MSTLSTVTMNENKNKKNLSSFSQPIDHVMDAIRYGIINEDI